MEVKLFFDVTSLRSRDDDSIDLDLVSQKKKHLTAIWNINFSYVNFFVKALSFIWRTFFYSSNSEKYIINAFVGSYLCKKEKVTKTAEQFSTIIAIFFYY